MLFTGSILAAIYTKAETYRIRVLRTFIFFLLLCYIPVGGIIFKSLACSDGYLINYPQVQCHSYYMNIVFTLALIGILIYIIGIPAVYYYSMKKGNNDPTFSAAVKFLKSPYISTLPYFEGFNIFRKLVLILLSSLLPSNYVLQPILLLLFILLLVVINLRLQPIINPLENSLELVSLFLILMNFNVASIASGSNEVTGEIPTILSIINYAFIAFMIVLTLLRQSERIKKLVVEYLYQLALKLVLFLDKNKLMKLNLKFLPNWIHFQILIGKLKYFKRKILNS